MPPIPEDRPNPPVLAAAGIPNAEPVADTAKGELEALEAVTAPAAGNFIAPVPATPPTPGVTDADAAKGPAVAGEGAAGWPPKGLVTAGVEDGEGAEENMANGGDGAAPAASDVGVEAAADEAATSGLVGGAENAGLEPAEVLNAVPNGAAKDPELAAEDEEGANPGDGEEGVALGADAWVLVSLALAASFGGCAKEPVVAGVALADEAAVNAVAVAGAALLPAPPPPSPPSLGVSPPPTAAMVGPGTTSPAEGAALEDPAPGALLPKSESEAPNIEAEDVDVMVVGARAAPLLLTVLAEVAPAPAKPPPIPEAMNAGAGLEKGVDNPPPPKPLLLLLLKGKDGDGLVALPAGVGSALGAAAPVAEAVPKETGLPAAPNILPAVEAEVAIGGNVSFAPNGAGAVAL
mmetsp:Transcript_35535/g.66986  ORF Transcript_35535/g.66986 Transcript_35535/m.66986 type:complete len:406 (-) Transcript_35535:3518-4735(-)